MRLSPKRLARLAGSVYLVQIFAGSFPFYVRAKLFEPDGAATAANVVASETLYRLGMLSEVLAGLFWMNLQTRYDLEREKDRLGDRLADEVIELAHAS